ISLALSLPHRNRADIGRIAPRMPCKSSFVSSTNKASASTTAPVVSECGIPCLAYTQEYPIPAHSSHQEPRRPKPPGNLRNLQENLSRNSKERIVSRYRMFNRAIRGQLWMSKYLSSDNDPLYRFHQWQANLRVLELTE